MTVLPSSEIRTNKGGGETPPPWQLRLRPVVAAGVAALAEDRGTAKGMGSARVTRTEAASTGLGVTTNFVDTNIPWFARPKFGRARGS